ncbi:MAG: LPXTG cell wall anchor domain-containing protein [Atopobiaceae bacterium]|nr:LPXTG cell wall anchor domain-containing protein [Atopobiaceae bacterium]
MSTARNELRIASYRNDPEGLERLKRRNMELYGDENGASPDFFYNRYGSWEMVIEKSFSVNSGMDACLGLYDDYYLLYVATGQIPADQEDVTPEPEPQVEPSPVPTIVDTPQASRPLAAAALPATGDEASSTPLVLVAAGGVVLSLGLAGLRKDEDAVAA